MWLIDPVNHLSRNATYQLKGTDTGQVKEGCQISGIPQDWPLDLSGYDVLSFRKREEGPPKAVKKLAGKLRPTGTGLGLGSASPWLRG